jgi:hypothetical protein
MDETVSDKNSPLASQKRSRTTKMTETASQAERFAQFLSEEEMRGVVLLFRKEKSGTHGSPIGVKGWYVVDISQWWEDAKEWHENGKSGTWKDSAFFMVLRRLGFHAMNAAPRPAVCGYDYALKREDADRSGAVVFMSCCVLPPWGSESRACSCTKSGRACAG